MKLKKIFFLFVCMSGLIGQRQIMAIHQQPINKPAVPPRPLSGVVKGTKNVEVQKRPATFALGEKPVIAPKPVLVNGQFQSVGTKTSPVSTQINNAAVKKVGPGTAPKPSKLAVELVAQKKLLKPVKTSIERNSFDQNLQKDLVVVESKPVPIVSVKNTQPLPEALKRSFIGKEFEKFDISFVIPEKLNSLDTVKQSAVKVVYDMNIMLQKDGLKPAEINNLVKILDETLSKTDDFIMSKKGEEQLQGLLYKEQLLLNRESLLKVRDTVEPKAAGSSNVSNTDFSNIKLKNKPKETVKSDKSDIVSKKYGHGIESMPDLFFNLDKANKKAKSSVSGYKTVGQLNADMTTLRNFEGGVYSPLLFKRAIENIQQKVELSNKSIKKEFLVYSDNLLKMIKKNSMPEAYVRNQLKILKSGDSSPALKNSAHNNLKLLLDEKTFKPEIKNTINKAAEFVQYQKDSPSSILGTKPNRRPSVDSAIFADLDTASTI